MVQRWVTAALWSLMTFLGVLMSLAIFAELSAKLGLLAITGFTREGFLWGGVILIFSGLFMSFYLARDIAIWALQASSFEEWLEDEGKEGNSNLKGIPDLVLAKIGWSWKKPLFFVYPSDEINVAGILKNRNQSVVLMSSKLLASCSSTEIEALLTHRLNYMKSGDAFFVLLMHSMMIPMTIFPARMMALLLGTSLRSSEEETPSDIVETLMIVLFEACFTLWGGLLWRQYCRLSAARLDREMAHSSFRTVFLEALEKDKEMRTHGHKERFTAPFCIFDNVPKGLSIFHCVNSSQTRLKRLQEIAQR